MRYSVRLWLLSLVVVAAFASALTAQVTRTPSRVVSGNDLGFRVTGLDSKGKPVGDIVIRINGEWIDVSDMAVSAPALTR